MAVDSIFDAVLAGGGLCAAIILYLALRSPLRPILIPVDAWRMAVASVRAKPLPAALAALVIGLGAGLQELFTYGPRPDDTVLTLASVGWQAGVAIVLATVAVPLHLHVVDREPRGMVIDDRIVRRARLGPLLPGAAALGGAIWLITYGFGVAGKLAAVSAPPDFAVLVYRGGQVAGFLVAALLALVRPALSAGLPRPIRTGLRMAITNLPALLTVQALMLIPPLAFGFVAIELVRTFLGLSIGVHVLNDVSIVIFSTLQYLAFEVSTVIVLLAATATPEPAAEARVAYA